MHPDLPTLKAYPYLGLGGRFKIFSAKMKIKDELKDTQSNFSPLLCISEHRIENCLGVVATPPLQRTRVNFLSIVNLKLKFGVIMRKKRTSG